MQSNSSTFVARYGVVLESAARRVHALVGRGQPYTTTGDVADYIVNNLTNDVPQDVGQEPSCVAREEHARQRFLPRRLR